MLPLALKGASLVHDLNYLLQRESVSIERARAAACPASRASHKGLASAYGKLIDVHYGFRRFNLPMPGDAAMPPERFIRS